MTRFIAFVSGKGGVGKTTVTLNVGLALKNLGLKTILLDANLATPNLALHLGILEPKATLNQFLRKEKELQEIIHKDDCEISFIPSSPSLAEYQLTKTEKLSEIFEHLDNLADFVLVDSPSGLGQDVNEVLKNTDESIIVVNPNLSSVMDSLKTIRLAKEHNNIVTGVILNMSSGKNEFKQKEIEDILGLPVISNIKYHNKFKKSLEKQKPLLFLYPRTKQAKELNKVAKYLTMRF